MPGESRPIFAMISSTDAGGEPLSLYTARFAISGVGSPTGSLGFEAGSEIATPTTNYVFQGKSSGPLLVNPPLQPDLIDVIDGTTDPLGFVTVTPSGALLLQLNLVPGPLGTHAGEQYQLGLLPGSSPGDLNAPTFFADNLLEAQPYATSTTLGGLITIVPEPSGWLLMTWGVGCLLLRRLSRRGTAGHAAPSEPLA